METELIAQLMLGKKAPKTPKTPNMSKGFVILRDTENDCLTKEAITPETRASLGKYEGRAGSIRRSRKGRTRRMPNGRRFYNGITDHEVVAYRLTP